VWRRGGGGGARKAGGKRKKGLGCTTNPSAGSILIADQRDRGRKEKKRGEDYRMERGESRRKRNEMARGRPIYALFQDPYGREDRVKRTIQGEGGGERRASYLPPLYQSILMFFSRKEGRRLLERDRPSNLSLLSRRGEMGEERERACRGHKTPPPHPRGKEEDRHAVREGRGRTSFPDFTFCPKRGKERKKRKGGDLREKKKKKKKKKGRHPLTALTSEPSLWTRSGREVKGKRKKGKRGKK